MVKINLVDNFFGHLAKPSQMGKNNLLCRN